MYDLDETDVEILSLLAEDARRPWREIADAVGLSPPAVSDRVSRLREAGIVRRFTVDLDRSTLRGGVPVLIDVEPNDLEAVREALAGAEATEHVFTTAERRLVVQARVPEGDVPAWLFGTVEEGTIESYSVTLLTAAEWTPSVGGTELALSCAECGNTVTSEGVEARIGGERHQFCCSSCRDRFEERYEEFEERAEG